MKENNNDWTDKLRSQLEKYQAPVGEDLWENIEQSLAQKTFARKSSRLLWWSKWGSIAASVALLLVGGSYLFMPDEAGKVVLTHHLCERQLAATDNADVTFVPTKANLAVSLNITQQQKLENMPSNETKSPLLARTSDSDEAIALLSSEPSVFEENHVEGEAMPRKSRVIKEMVTDRQVANATAAYDDVGDVPEASHKKQAIGVKLYAENGIMGKLPSEAGNGNVYNEPMGSSVSGANILMSVESARIVSVEKPTHVKHHFPLSLGLQVSIPVAQRLSVYTGLVYTRTTSDFVWENISGETTKTQTLHYLGIPLGLSYEVWGTSRLHTYTNVGAEGAFNVKNHTEVDGEIVKAASDRMQWSGNLSVGVQYDVLPQVGVYVEPGMKYYFNNGSSIENTFKDKKLNFNFQFGLRAHF